MSAQLQVTHTSHVTEDQIDHLGHMNVRFYGINAAAGTHTMLEEIGVPARTPIVDIHTRHHHEQVLGSALEVRSGLVEVGRDLAIYHELRNTADDDLAASFVHVLDHPRIGAPVAAVPEHGRPRSLDLATDPVSSAPSLEVLRQLGLESRLPRVVDDEVTAATGLGLIWGGPPPKEHESDWIQQGPNGERMGWATMESRLRVNRLPPLGTRIQSFGATTAIERKTTRSTMWAYDLVEGDVLVAFEIVNLAFDIDSRRSMLIPDDYLASEQRRFHPEFAPQ
jgi:acyl-CoA thioesterase FadM